MADKSFLIGNLNFRNTTSVDSVAGRIIGEGDTPAGSFSEKATGSFLGKAGGVPGLFGDGQNPTIGDLTKRKISDVVSTGAIPPGIKIDLNKSGPLIHTKNGSNDSEDTILSFEPNILDNYDMVTYHYKLFMTSNEVSYSGEYLNPAKQVIIAESGVSDLTIDRVELYSIAAPSVESGTGTQVSVKFEIVEPAGAGLLDKMFYESVLLGIGNWFVMPCYLQLSFKARNVKTSNADSDGSPGVLGGLVWCWPIKISKGRANVTTVGTRYEFDAIMYNELAQSNAYFTLQHSAHLNNVNTFGSAMIDLEEKLNKDQWIKLAGNYSKADTYRIVVDPMLAGIKIKPSNDNENSQRSGSFTVHNDKTATFKDGTGIDKIIDSLLANTDEFQREILGSGNQTAQGGPATINGEIDKMKKFWRITTETRPISYDYKRQDNAVEIVIFVFMYELGVNPASPTQTGGTAETRQASRDLLNEYITKKVLKKKYNYIFTGLNDQVITFDLNMNFSFAAALSRFGGVYYDSAAKDIGTVFQDNADEERKFSEQVINALKTNNGAKQEKDPVKLQEKVDALDKSLKASTVSDDRKRELALILTTTKPADRMAIVRVANRLEGGLTDVVTKNLIRGKSEAGAGRGFINPQLVNGAVIPGSENESVLIDKSLKFARERATRIASPPNSNLKFISDLNTRSPAVQKAFEEFETLSKGKLRPIPFRETSQDTALGPGVEASSDSGKNKLSSLFSTALYSTIDGSLLHIKMTIKGDPFWLFPQPVTGEKYDFLSDEKDINKIMRTLKKRQIDSPNSVNLFGTDNFIAVRFRTPRIYNEKTNPSAPDPFTEVETFCGVFKVITLISKFEMGKFTQELSCILDPVIDTYDLLRKIEEDAKKLDKPTTPGRLEGKELPPTATKTDKMKGAGGNKLADARATIQMAKNKITGVADTVRSVSGKIHDAGQSLNGVLGTSNIPGPAFTDLVTKAQKYLPNTPIASNPPG